MTIVESIKAVIKSAEKPLTIEHIYELIVEKGLYQFKAKRPKGVVAAQVRRHCIGIDFPTAKPVKHFPPETLDQMIENDFEFAANNRKRILAEWQKRYDSKSDPKN